MKKSLRAIVLAMLLCVSLFVLVGCGDEATGNNTQSTSSNSSSSESNILQVPMQVRNMVPETTIKELYISGAGVNTWSDDLLGSQVMPTGTQLTLTFNIDKNNVKWDIKAVDEEGTAVEFRNLDLSNVNTTGGVITLAIENGVPVATAQ